MSYVIRASRGSYSTKKVLYYVNRFSYLRLSWQLASLSRWEINSMYCIWQTQILLKKGQWTLPYQGTLSWDDRGIVIKGIPPRPHQEIPCTAHSVLLVWDFFHCKPWIDYMRLQSAQTCILTGSCTSGLFIESLGHQSYRISSYILRYKLIWKLQPIEMMPGPSKLPQYLKFFT